MAVSAADNAGRHNDNQSAGMTYQNEKLTMSNEQLWKHLSAIILSNFMLNYA